MTNFKGWRVNSLLFVPDTSSFVSGVRNSKACRSDVPLGNAEDTPSAYNDPRLQDLLPLWAAPITHHQHSKVRHDVGHRRCLCCSHIIDDQLINVAPSHALQAVWRTNLERLHLLALLPFALWNFGRSDVWHFQPSLCYKWYTKRVRTTSEKLP